MKLLTVIGQPFDRRPTSAWRQSTCHLSLRRRILMVCSPKSHGFRGQLSRPDRGTGSSRSCPWRSRRVYGQRTATRRSRLQLCRSSRSSGGSQRSTGTSSDRPYLCFIEKKSVRLKIGNFFFVTQDLPWATAPATAPNIRPKFMRVATQDSCSSVALGMPSTSSCNDSCARYGDDQPLARPTRNITRPT